MPKHDSNARPQAGEACRRVVQSDPATAAAWRRVNQRLRAFGAIIAALHKTNEYRELDTQQRAGLAEMAEAMRGALDKSDAEATAAGIKPKRPRDIDWWANLMHAIGRDPGPMTLADMVDALDIWKNMQGRQSIARVDHESPHAIPPDAMTREKARQALGLRDAGSVSRLLKKGKLKGWHADGRVWIDRQSVEARHAVLPPKAPQRPVHTWQCIDGHTQQSTDMPTSCPHPGCHCHRGFTRVRSNK